MKRYFLVILLSCFGLGTVQGQSSLKKIWDKRFGGTWYEELTSLKQTSDNGYILAGRSMSGISGDKTQNNWGPIGTLDDYWIIKIDSMGIKQWDKRFGGTSEDWAYDIQNTSDGGYIIGGESLSDANGDKSQPIRGYYDYWIVKTDSIGNKLWDKRFGGDHYDGLRSVQQTNEGGYILGGDSKSQSYGDKTQSNWDSTFNTTDYWIVKINVSGIKEWDKRFGGFANDHFHSMVQTIDGGFILAGISYSGIGGDKTTPSHGGWDYWIVKIDSLGSIQWDKDFGGSLDENRDFSDNEFGNIIATDDGNYLISGNSKSNKSGDKSEDNLGQTGGWIIKIDASGNKLWDKTILVNGATKLGSTIQLADGCYQVGTWTNAGIAGYKTQNNWTGGTFYDYWTVKLCDCVAGELPVSTFTSTNHVGCAPICVTFSNNSNCYDSHQWIFPGGTPAYSNDQIPTVCYAIGGYYPVTLITSNIYGSDTLVLNNYIHIRPDTPTINEIGNVITSSLAVAYQWYLSDTLLSGATAQQYTVLVDGYYFVCITDSAGCVACSDSIYITVSTIQTLMENTRFSISPNPTTGGIEIDLGLIKKEHVQILISDITDQMIFESMKFYSESPLKISFDLSKFSSGMYLVKIITDSTIVVRKVIKN